MSVELNEGRFVVWPEFKLLVLVKALVDTLPLWGDIFDVSIPILPANVVWAVPRLLDLQRC